MAWTDLGRALRAHALGRALDDPRVDALRRGLREAIANMDASLRQGLLRSYDIDSLDNRNEAFIDYLSRNVVDLLVKYFDAEVRGLERIPSGAGLYVGNHNAGMLTPDSFIFGGAVYQAHGIDAVPYGLGHEIAISLPVAHQLVMPLGAVRASHENAHRLFRRGAKVMVYPGGDRDAMRPFRLRNRIVFGGRRGYIRLAVREGVPIIPVVAAGAHSTFIVIDDLRWLARLTRMDRLFRLDVFPLVLSAPWGLTVGPLPVYLPYPSRILIEVLEPIAFERTGAEAARDEVYVLRCAQQVESTMQSALERLAAERQKQG